MTPDSLAAWAGLGLAIGATIVATMNTRRARRLARRLRRLDDRVERQRNELLSIAKAAAARRVAEQLASANREPRLPVAFRSEFGEDLVLAELFDGQLDGFFIEVGAYDGITNAVTWFLGSRGWRGLLIEAIPARAAEAKAARPDASVVHAALGRRGSTGTTTLTTYAEGSRDELGAHLADVSGRLKRPAGDAAHSQITHTVPLTTLADLLDDPAHGPPESRRVVDVAVIDVEGAEPDVIDGLDLARWRPRVLIVEDHSLGRDRALTDALTAKNAPGYVLAGFISYNRVLVREDEVELLARAERLFGRPR